VRFPATLEVPDPILQIARILEGAGFEAWCVGGTLRDTLLGQPQSDFDIATSATPEQVQRLFPRTVEVGVKYGTVGVLDRDRVLHEVTTFRRDVITDGRHAQVQYGVSLEDDLARRDFTINAIAYHPIRREWRDPFAGSQDLERRLVRAVGDPAQRFREDYLRILRAIRFAARFDFAIDPRTWDAALAEAPGLTRLSAERVREEWFKGLQTARSVTRFASLWVQVGAARVWIPELETWC
jgi:tRNA nucleotidyltransferase (CCA-adding enzyme)